MSRPFAALALLFVAGVAAVTSSCARKSTLHLRCARSCQSDNDQCLTAATQSSDVDACTRTNTACTNACPP